jgi:type VI protein secretion system component VasF
VEVFNLLGQEVLSINPKANSAKIQTSSLSKGVYVITATIDDVVSSSKFIKQ